LMVSLSDLHYGDDSEAILSPTIRVVSSKQVEERKCRTKCIGSPIQESKASIRSEFIPELTEAGVYQPMPVKEDPPVSYVTPESHSDDSEVFNTRFSNKTDSLYQLPALNSDGNEYLDERSPTTIFTTRSIAEENMRDLQNFLKQQLGSVGSPEERSLETILGNEMSPASSPKEESKEDKVAVIRVERKKSGVVRTEEGRVLAKKLATQAEQKGMRECHVYFTPRTSAEIWPPLVVTVGEDWDFVKVMRKSIANLRRAMNKGERDGTHDWLFDYHPNKDIKKIKKDLKVLFGRKVVSFRDSNLKKSVKDVTGDFINKMWILQKDDDKHQKTHLKTRIRSQSFNKSKSPRKRASSPKSRRMKGRSKTFRHKKNTKSLPNHYTRLSQRV